MTSRFPPKSLLKFCQQYDPSLKIVSQKRLGQNFLIDQQIAKQIVESVGNISSDTILEIGPGLGMLSAHILKANPYQLISVEKDHNFLPLLQRMSQDYETTWKIIADDAIKIEEKVILAGIKNCQIIANLPYNISIVLLFKWLENLRIFKGITIMLQKEVAQRIIASNKSKSYGWISIIFQILCQIKVILQVEPESFWPQPKIHSTVIHLIPFDKPKYQYHKLWLPKLCKQAFNMRRKTLRNSLSIFSPLIPWKQLESKKIFPRMRPEELSIEQWCILSLVVRNS